MLVERTHCPKCGHPIIQEFDDDNRLFGNELKCKSHLCGYEFIASCSQIYEKGKEPEVSVREIIRPKDQTELEEGQTMLTEFV